MAIPEPLVKGLQYVKTHKLVVLLAVLAFIFFVMWMYSEGSSSFEDRNAINRFIVGQDGRSMDDKINDAINAKSPLTGTRDIPVFFQNYNLELERDATTGNLVANRGGETLAGDKDEIAEIEKKFMLG